MFFNIIFNIVLKSRDVTAFLKLKYKKNFFSFYLKFFFLNFYIFFYSLEEK